MIQMQKAVVAVGMFSLFEAILQDGLDCESGFSEANSTLKRAGEERLCIDFANFQRAINVLKHGRGRSYDELVQRADALPFRIKLPTEGFFFEGDVSEISTLVEVDDEFVRGCAKIIREVAVAIRKAKPGARRCDVGPF
jgi:hypothetical protein